MKTTLIALMPIFWVIFAIIVIAYLYLAKLFIRQKIKKLRSRSEIFDFLENGVYCSTGNLDVLAGEANISIYSKLCIDIEGSLSKNKTAKATFVVGPKLSYWKKDSQYLVDGLVSRKNSDQVALQMHPLFSLLDKFPNRFSLYLKTGHNNEPHFAIGDDFIYVEKQHKPLEESTAMFIDNPSLFLKIRYKRKYKQLLASKELKKITCAKDIKEHVKFGYSVDTNEMCS